MTDQLVPEPPRRPSAPQNASIRAVKEIERAARLPTALLALLTRWWGGMKSSSGRLSSPYAVKGRRLNKAWRRS